MNKNIDLTKILKDCPNRFKLYPPLMGEVVFIKVSECTLPLPVMTLHSSGIYLSFTKEGYYFNFNNKDSECLLFPSKDQRDWSKFTAPWYKKEKFDPKTLMAFDKVLVRLTKDCIWNATFFSHYDKEVNWGCYPCVTTSCKSYDKCIPYNDETKHLLGTSEEAPEYYRYWED